MSYATNDSRAPKGGLVLQSGRLPGYCSRSWRTLIASALLPVLAGCYGNDNSCYNCGVTPFEVSLGVAAAEFNGNGFNSVVALNAIEPDQTLGPDNLKVYLSTGAGA